MWSRWGIVAQVGKEVGNCGRAISAATPRSDAIAASTAKWYRNWCLLTLKRYLYGQWHVRALSASKEVTVANCSALVAFKLQTSAPQAPSHSGFTKLSRENTKTCNAISNSCAVTAKRNKSTDIQCLLYEWNTPRTQALARKTRGAAAHCPIQL